MDRADRQPFLIEVHDPVVVAVIGSPGDHQEALTPEASGVAVARGNRWIRRALAPLYSMVGYYIV